MKIDRQRFFSLAFGLAGVTACAKEHDAPPVLAPLEVAVPPQPTPPTPLATEAPAPLAPSASAAAQPTPPAPTTEAVLTSNIDVYDPNGKHTCSELRCPTGHPFAEGMKVLQHDCRGLERGLRPEHFQRFIQCMLKQNNTRATCDLFLVSADPGDCLERWAEPKVLDTKTASVCAPIVQKCANRPPPRPYPGMRMPGQPIPPPPPPKSPLTVAACQGVLSVTKDAARTKMVACITEYCEDAQRLCYMNL